MFLYIVHVGNMTVSQNIIFSQTLGLWIKHELELVSYSSFVSIIACVGICVTLLKYVNHVRILINCTVHNVFWRLNDQLE